MNLLFLCTGNSCRSQMAEGWARHFHGAEHKIYSAGIETHGLNPHAVAVMAEAGVDISGHRSKLLSDLADTKIDLVITVCDHARESCPHFPAKAILIHHSFPDPPALAKEAATPDEALAIYRKVRDEIRDFVRPKPTSW